MDERLLTQHNKRDEQDYIGQTHTKKRGKGAFLYQCVDSCFGMINGLCGLLIDSVNEEKNRIRKGAASAVNQQEGIEREREGGVDSGLSIPVGPHHDRKAQYVTNNANQSNSYIRKRGVIIDDIVHPLT